MKLKSIKKKIWSIVIIVTTLIGILPVQANTTETPVKDVELDGADGMILLEVLLPIAP